MLHARARSRAEFCSEVYIPLEIQDFRECFAIPPVRQYPPLLPYRLQSRAAVQDVEH